MAARTPVPQEFYLHSQNGMKISHVEGNTGLITIFKRCLFFAPISLRPTNTNMDPHQRNLKLGGVSPAP